VSDIKGYVAEVKRMRKAVSNPKFKKFEEGLREDISFRVAAK
jgi:hypothetical protein